VTVVSHSDSAEMNAFETVEFLIDDSPVTFVGPLVWINRQFLRGIDPEFWVYQGTAHATSLNGDDSKASQRAAASLRLAYGQGIETLLALLCAMAQCPKFPVGWLTNYRVAQLTSVVRKIHEDRLEHHVLRAGSPTWARLAELVFTFRTEDPPPYDVAAKYGALWTRLAGEFLRDDFAPDYNSLKHGMRSQVGGFQLSLQTNFSGERDKPWKVLMGSPFGSTFVRARKLESKKEKLRHTFTLDIVSRAWSARQFASRWRLIALSIQSVRNRLLHIADGGRGGKVFWPNDALAFHQAWDDPPDLISMVRRSGIRGDALSETSGQVIRAKYRRRSSDQTTSRADQ
jgi:hypothetical protein